MKTHAIAFLISFLFTFQAYGQITPIKKTPAAIKTFPNQQADPMDTMDIRTQVAYLREQVKTLQKEVEQLKKDVPAGYLLLSAGLSNFKKEYATHYHLVKGYVGDGMSVIPYQNNGNTYSTHVVTAPINPAGIKDLRSTGNPLQKE